MAANEDPHIHAYEGFSYGTEERPASIEDAIVDAASKTHVEADGVWFDILRLQAEVVPHNQWAKTYKVIITPS
jgi:hypothetical protein